MRIAGIAIGARYNASNQGTRLSPGRRTLWLDSAYLNRDLPPVGRYIRSLTCLVRTDGDRQEKLVTLERFSTLVNESRSSHLLMCSSRTNSPVVSAI